MLNSTIDYRLYSVVTHRCDNNQSFALRLDNDMQLWTKDSASYLYHHTATTNQAHVFSRLTTITVT